MGENPRAADAGSSGEAGLRAGGTAARRVAGSEEPARPDRDQLGRFVLTEPALEAWGRRIGAQTELPFVLALRGELGAGKSVLARAVARGAGVTGSMPSPTFNLLFQYETERAQVLHF